jgi:hypothetical protein
MGDFSGLKALIERIFRISPEWPYFSAYLEVAEKEQKYPYRPAPIALATFGAIAIAGGIVLAALSAPLVFGIFAFVAGTGLGAVGAAGIAADGAKHRQRPQEEIDAEKVRIELADWDRRRRLGSKLGAGVGELLNQGARHWIECQQAFESYTWSGFSEDSVWAQTRARSLEAMDVAMRRLLIAVNSANVAGAEFMSPYLDPAMRLVGEMREMANHAMRLTDKLAAEGVGAPLAGEIREAMAELSRLDEAQDELNRLRQGR